MQELWIVQHSWLIPLLPLIGAAIAGLFGAKFLRQQSHWPIWLGVGAAAVMSLTLLFQTLHLAGESEAPAGNHAAMKEGGESSTELSAVKDFFTWVSVGDPASNNTADHPQEVLGNPGAHFEVKAGFFFDTLTVIMLCVVTGIGFLITVFSAGYMHGEEGYWRFFAYLGLFIFMMCCLVMGNNLIMLYLGWEGVGLSSYLLIGYYYEKPSAREAAKKAFLVNRVGDFGFGVGIMLCFVAFGTVSYFGQGVNTHTGLLELAGVHLGALQQRYLYWIPFCLMLGAFGKSAQFPLYVWLPDAMEGPTPVSALIHAATMVTAGVYMIARCGPLFVQNGTAMTTIAAVGTFTALLAATIALRQFDLKKVFAYSTISQLGFMFVAVGALCPVAGVFHLVTHAFFKALLFLSCGVVMHAMAGELDMRKMSGLHRVLPITNIVILIGCFALAGFPLFSGFFSKDDIVGAAFHKHWIFGALLLFTAFLTAYYTFRLYFRVFQGPLVVPEAPAPAHGHGHEPDEHATASQSAIETHTAPASGVDVGQAQHAPLHDDHGHGHDGHHNHEPMIMMLPLIILAIGALLAGYLNFPGEWFAEFLGKSPSLQQTFKIAESINHDPHLAALFGQPETSPVGHNWMLMLISGLISIAGVGLAYVMHLRDRALADRVARGLGPITWAIEGKYWVDQIYQGTIVEPLRLFGKLFAFVIDRFIVDGLIGMAAYASWAWGFFLKITFQRGYLQGYAASMLLGIAIILLVIFFR
ncbi:MAG TPA: NADH-quinone oxidoreductase subunit L [Tepidisphaeraceae bacterium]|nr:NADH-quinone oxidoreductase subunit L [Tepidisphaeraceae bacterium]